LVIERAVQDPALASPLHSLLGRCEPDFGDANKQRSIVGQDWRRDRDPKSASRAVKEHLATLDDMAWGAASDIVPKFVSPSNPAAEWTGAHEGPGLVCSCSIAQNLRQLAPIGPAGKQPGVVAVRSTRRFRLRSRQRVAHPVHRVEHLALRLFGDLSTPRLWSCPAQ
jgi:hypothetical protein